MATKWLMRSLAIIAFIAICGALTVSARRSHHMCRQCGAGRETFAWRTLAFVEITSTVVGETPPRKEAPHKHDWWRHSYTERFLPALIISGRP